MLNHSQASFSFELTYIGWPINRIAHEQLGARNVFEQANRLGNGVRGIAGVLGWLMWIATD